MRWWFRALGGGAGGAGRGGGGGGGRVGGGVVVVVGLEHSRAQKLAGLVSSAGEGAGPIKLSVEKPVQPH